MSRSIFNMSQSHHSYFEIEENDDILYEGKMTWKANWWLFPFAILFLLAGNIYCIIIGILFIAWAFLDANVSHYVITKKNIFIKNNLLLRKKTIIPRNSISSVELEYILFGRLLNYGTIKIFQDKKRTIMPGVPDPKKVFSLIS